MSGIVKIDGEVFGSADFIKILKLNGRFENLMEEILKDQLAVRAAIRLGVKLSDDDIQERADQFRRVHDLHRARDANEYFDALGVTLEDFETFITHMLYQEKVFEQVCSEQAIEEFFKANSPMFESIEVSHIVVDSDGVAKELMSVLGDDPDSFRELAQEHSLADTRADGGRIGKMIRGCLNGDVEAKVFNAQEGDLLGPFPVGDAAQESFEIFRIDSKRSAMLDDEAREEIQRLLKDHWLAVKAREHRIEML